MKTWLVHSYGQPPCEVPHREALKLLRKYGGSYAWLNDVCHLYLLPKLDLTPRYAGQEELDPLKRSMKGKK